MPHSAQNEQCVFCSIVAGTLRSAIVFEDEATLAFLDITAVAPGHTLVIPKAHARDLWEIAPDDWAAVGRTVHRMAQRIGDVLQPAGMTLFQANRDTGWQDVFHLHVHLVPRTEADRLHRPWTASPVPLDSLEDIRLRLSLREDDFAR
ncbi:HIT domain-containing protein [Longispora sp. NPDC051575]|uniref:HIT family protein n=1 Tax=Longispora sp. NPDC051575 TaxID=3154943 RepID=UPI0034459034